MAREYVSFVTQIEVECETLEQVTEAAACGADVIMLDNMDNETMRKAVKIIDGRAKDRVLGQRYRRAPAGNCRYRRGFRILRCADLRFSGDGYFAEEPDSTVS